MIIYFFILIAIILFSCSRQSKDQWKKGYISVEQSTNIKGIFVLEIFLGHVFNYIHSSSLLDTSYLSVKSHLAQAVVVMFLFYSGFGMTESLKKKKSSYIFTIPKKHIIPIYIKFLLSFILIVSIKYCLGYRPPLQTLLQAMIGWENIGNFGWYTFVIIVLYFLFMFSFRIGTNNGYNNKTYIISAGILTVLTVLFQILMIYPGFRPGWFYDTTLLFPAGVWYSLFKTKIDIFLDKTVYYFFTCFCFSVLYISFNFLSYDSFLFTVLWYFIFAIVVILISMRIKIHGPILSFFGRMAYPMLLMLGISYTVLYYSGLPDSYPYIFVAAAFVITVILSILFSKCTSFIERIGSIQTKTHLFI